MLTWREKEIRVGKKAGKKASIWWFLFILFIYSSPSIIVYLGLSASVNLFTFALSARGLQAILILVLLCEGLIIHRFYPNMSPDFCASSSASWSPLPRPPELPPPARGCTPPRPGVLCLPRLGSWLCQRFTPAKIPALLIQFLATLEQRSLDSINHVIFW